MLLPYLIGLNSFFGLLSKFWQESWLFQFLALLFKSLDFSELSNLSVETSINHVDGSREWKESDHRQLLPTYETWKEYRMRGQIYDKQNSEYNRFSRTNASTVKLFPKFCKIFPLPSNSSQFGTYGSSQCAVVNLTVRNFSGSRPTEFTPIIHRHLGSRWNTFSTLTIASFAESLNLPTTVLQFNGRR